MELLHLMRNSRQSFSKAVGCTPLAFVLGLIGGSFMSLFTGLGRIVRAAIGGSYATAALFFSVRAGAGTDLRSMALAVPLFLALHLSYGLGSLWGLVTVRKTPVDQTAGNHQ